MEARKYSTGTKGRIKMHNDKCREFVQANAPSFSLANEFIASIDPDHDERVWQKFQSPADILPELQAWLGGETGAPSVPQQSLPTGISARLPVKTASHLARPTEKIDAALKKTRAWLTDESKKAEFNALPPVEASESALRKFYSEITGVEPE